MSTANVDKFILGYKVGMSQVFDDKGLVIPVTVIEASPNIIVQIKRMVSDGYDAVQVGFGDIKKSNVNKPRKGHLEKAGLGLNPKRILREFRVADTNAFQMGAEIKVDVFAEGDMVDVSAKTKGRGFTGVVQRWNHTIGPKSHGSGHHRGVGSTGANSDPSRVFPGKHMPGQYGNEKVTVQNLQVVKVDVARNAILVKGGIPGPDGGLVTIKTAVKRQKKGGAK